MRVTVKAGGLRERALPDFFVGAHAELDGLAVPARYRTCFPVLDIVAPDTHPWTGT